MKTSCSVLLSFLAALSPAGASLVSISANLQERPTTKVVTLLKDMAEQLEKEGETDEEVYDTMACWCKTNDREKTTAISDAEAHITDLETTIEATTSQSARLQTQIEGHESDLAKATKGLDQAKSLREKELSEFSAEEKDLLQSIGALGSAIVVLSKHHASASAFLEEGEAAALAKAAEIARSQLASHKSFFQGTITPRQRSLVSAFAQTSASFAQQEPNLAVAQTHTALRTALHNKNPASGEIFGILKQMKETFETNLAATQKDAASDQEKYQNLKAAKEAEISALTTAIEEKKVTHAAADEENAVAKEDLADTKNSLTADEAFIIDLKKRCSNMDAEWEARQKMRQEEIVAVAEAISILTSDDAQDNFSKTQGFLQLKQESRSSVSDGRRSAAARILTAAAAKTGNAQMTSLASVVQLDAFVEVKKAIDNMIGELREAKAAEIKHKDSCVNQFSENTRFTEASERDQVDLQANIDALTANIEEVTAAVKTLKGEIDEMTVQLKRAGEDREKENKEFQETVNDQRVSQELLQKAVSVLKGVYAKKDKAALVQQSVQAHVQAAKRDSPPPPPGFKEYKKAGGAGGVVGLIEQIIAEAKHVEKMAIKDEEDAQEQYESFVKETNNSVETKREAIVNKDQDKADTEQSLTQAKVDHASVTEELTNLDSENAALHQGCDFLLKNFDLRQGAFDEEVEALQQATAILSGMEF